jgi:hypothetical protein
MPTFPVQYPMVNGHRYSWASVEIGANNGAVVRGIKSIDYDHSLTPTKIMGTGPNPVGRTRGVYEAKATIEMYRTEWENLKATLGQSGVGFGETSFPITCQYADVGQPVVTDTLEGCRVENPSFSGAEGADALTVKITLNVMRILENGLPLYTPTSGG